ncbi:MAG TPA: AMP-binding protein, partial [Blastocatellia bacterium]|nr:AMP-binding protein [Blastocatellia bacterium]
MEYKRQTINQQFRASVEKYGDREFLRYKSAGKWSSFSYKEVERNVRYLALALHDTGIRAGERVAIWSENRPEWNFADLAILALGAVDVPIYTTQSRADIVYILTDAGATTIFVSPTFFADALEIKESVGCLSRVISFDCRSGEADGTRLFDLQRLIEIGEGIDKRDPELYERLSSQV